MMASAAKTDQTAVAAKTESGGSCTVTVQRDPLGKHLLRYQGAEPVVAALTPEVIESLTAALSLRGRAVVAARCAAGGACTLLVMGHRSGGATLYFHAVPATSAVLDAAQLTQLRAALEALSTSSQAASNPSAESAGRRPEAAGHAGRGYSGASRQNGETGPTPAPSG